MHQWLTHGRDGRAMQTVARDNVDVCGEVLSKGAFSGAFMEVWPAMIADSLVAGGVKVI
jgi:hypothetical protein